MSVAAEFAITTPGKGTRFYDPTGSCLLAVPYDVPEGEIHGMHIVMRPDPDWQPGPRCHAGPAPVVVPLPPGPRPG